MLFSLLMIIAVLLKKVRNKSGITSSAGSGLNLILNILLSCKFNGIPEIYGAGNIFAPAIVRHPSVGWDPWCGTFIERWIPD
jgi:hypothetical protein